MWEYIGTGEIESSGTLQFRGNAKSVWIDRRYASVKGRRFFRFFLSVRQGHRNAVGVGLTRFWYCGLGTLATLQLFYSAGGVSHCLREAVCVRSQPERARGMMAPKCFDGTVGGATNGFAVLGESSVAPFAEKLKKKLKRKASNTRARHGVCCREP